MANFKELRQSIGQSRKELIQWENIQYNQQETKKIFEQQITAKLQDLGTDALPTTDPLVKELQSINQKLNEVQQKIPPVKEDLSGLMQEMDTVSVEEQMEELQGEIPFLLLPLRIQTRFMQIRHIVQNIDPDLLFDIKGMTGQRPTGSPWSLGNLKIPTGGYSLLPGIIGTQAPILHRHDDAYELWVRIYPDDIFVDAHEENLTPAEYEAAKIYWAAVYQADTTFLSSIENETDQEQAINHQYQAKLKAWTQLHQRYGMTRAAWVAKKTMPANRHLEAGVELKEAPIFPEVDLKSNSWTKAPQTYILPERFTFRLYKGDEYQEVLGQPINFPLYLGVGPNQGQDGVPIEENGEIIMPEETAWLTDFEAAEKAGMAIKIQLKGGINQLEEGYDKLIVLGIKSTADEKEGQQLLESLLEGHQHKSRGIGFMPIGTPTNNIEGQTAFSDHRSTKAEKGFNLEMQEPLFTWTDTHHNKSDGQRLTEALGLDPKAFHHLQHSDGQEGSHSLAMNRLLWPATMGSYLNNFFSPLLDREDVEKVYDFFTNYVSGRGLLSTLHIGQQPYGILPTTAYSRWACQTQGPKVKFQQKLHEVLALLEQSWTRLVSTEIRNVSNFQREPDYPDFFNDLLSMAPHSTHFHGRGKFGYEFATGKKERGNKIFPSGTGGRSMTDPTRFKFDIGNNRHFSAILELLNGNYSDIHLAQKYHLTNIFHAHLAKNRPHISPIIQPEELGDTVYLAWLSEASFPDIYSAGKENQEAFPFFYAFARYATLKAYLDTAYGLLQQADKGSPYLHLDPEILLHTPSTDYHSTFHGKLLFHDVYNKLLKRDRSAAFSNAMQSNRPGDMNYINNAIRKGNSKREANAINEIKNRRKNWIEYPKRWDYLTATFTDLIPSPEQHPFINPEILSEGLKMYDFIEKSILAEDSKHTRILAGVKAAAQQLEQLNLETQKQLFVEHMDLCSYRLDAWKQGQVLERLETQRSEENTKNGIYLGAYGYLEDLRYDKETADGVALRVVEAKTFAPASEDMPRYFSIIPVLDLVDFLQAPKKVQEQSFVYLGDSNPGVVWDPESKSPKPVPLKNREPGDGFLHAPTMGHAAAAAILRSGYTEQKQDNSATGNPLAVNLDSKRVRKALHYMEGIQNGQTLAALLGYQLERALHDHKDNLNVFIFELRKQYPLVEEGEDSQIEEPTEAIRPLNLIDGLTLIEDVREGNQRKIKVAIKLSGAKGKEAKDAIDACMELIKELDETLDGISDLLIAESVYQWTNGNPARARAALRALDDGGNIQLPEIVESPLRGTILTHRVGVLLETEPLQLDDPWKGPLSPAALASPHLNHWLKKQLPAPSQVQIAVSIDGKTRSYALSDFSIQPIDLLYLLRNGVSEEENEFTLWLSAQLRKMEWSYEHQISIDLASREKLNATAINFIELMPLVNSLLHLLANCKAFTSGDFISDKRDFVTNQVVTVEWEKKIRKLLSDAPGSLPKTIDQLDQAINTLSASSQTNEQAGYTQLQQQVLQTNLWRVAQSLLSISPQVNPADAETLIQTARQIKDKLQIRLDLATELLQKLDGLNDENQRAKLFDSINELLFNKQLKVFPEFRQAKPQIWEHAFVQRDTLLPDNNPYAVDEWLQGLTKVRVDLKNYQTLSFLREGFDGTDAEQELQVVQLPMRADGKNEWVGIEFSADLDLEAPPLSLALEIPENYQAESLQAGFIIDEWTEKIPEKEMTTGVSFNYDQPNSEPAQVMLLAVSPRDDGKWEWEDLMLTILDTFDLAKKRAVDPSLLLRDPLTMRVLPAIAPILTKEDFNVSMNIFQHVNTGIQSRN